jgi:transcriptional regulator with XRE-family HTH domain
MRRNNTTSLSGPVDSQVGVYFSEPRVSPMYTELTLGEISAKLRAVRLSKSLSLNDVERMSEGSLKAVVLGSYERGSRSLSVKRALHICKLYEIPINELFGEKPHRESAGQVRPVLDLRRISARRLDLSHPQSSRYELIDRLVRNILHQRQDWNGEILSIRNSDCNLLAIMTDIQSEEMMQWLETEKILFHK